MHNLNIFSKKKKKHLNNVIVIVFNCTCVYTWVYILVVGFFLFSFFFFFSNTQAQIETRTLGLIFVIWWTGLGLSQMCWADYEPSCAQKKKHGSYNAYTSIHTKYIRIVQ